MKKALALVLALVLALSLGVSAFALDLVPLKEAPKATADVIDISDDVYQLTKDSKYGKVYLVPAEGGTFYVTLDGDKEFKDIKVTGTGIVSAKLVDYDPVIFDGAETTWHVEYNGEVLGTDITGDSRYADASDDAYEATKFFSKYAWYNTTTEKLDRDLNETELTDFKWFYEREGSATEGKFDESVAAFIAYATENYKLDFNGWTIKKVYDVDKTSEDYCVALAAALNKYFKTSSFKVVSDENVYVIELTVAENYSAAYKEGGIKVEAKEYTGKTDSRGKKIYKDVSGSLKVISDVAIFEYEMVKWAGRNDEALVVEDETGYSDYLTALKGYNEVYDGNKLRYDEATVISTTAFRALREAKDGIKVESKKLLVTIPEIAAGQKGVNFSAYRVEFLNAKGEEADRGEAVEVVFGFYGNQVIASDFTVEANLGKDAYELREMFGEKVEEEDIITYYVVEGDKVVGQFTVDYMKDDIDENIELKIERKAGSTLGQYKVVLEVPAAPSEGEENPNTGAESVIGVVAAMAVVSVAAAAAVSLKK